MERSLIGMSVGQQPSVWQQLADATSVTKLVLVVGSKDAKFVQVMDRVVADNVNAQKLGAKHLQQALGNTSNCSEAFAGQCGLVAILMNECGHAVHIEHPETLLQLLASV